MIQLQNDSIKGQKNLNYYLLDTITLTDLTLNNDYEDSRNNARNFKLRRNYCMCMLILVCFPFWVNVNYLMFTFPFQFEIYFTIIF